MGSNIGTNTIWNSNVVYQIDNPQSVDGNMSFSGETTPMINIVLLLLLCLIFFLVLLF